MNKLSLKKSSLCLFLVITMPFTFASIYKSINPNGGVVFSDIPVPNSTEIGLTQINIANQNQTSSNANSTQEPQNTDQQAAAANTDLNEATAAPSAAGTNYTSIEISSPTNETTFQNQQSITVTVQVKPDLAKEDSVQLILDGALYGKPQHNLDFIVDNLSRGTHTVQAVIVNAQQNRQKTSQAVIFYIHQASQLLKAI